MIFLLIGVTEATRVNGELPELNAQVLRPSLSSERMLFTEEATVFPDGFFSAVSAEYTDAPILYRWHSGATVDLIDLLLQSDIAFGYTYAGYQTSLLMPIYLQSTGLAGSERGVGDLQVDVKKAFTDGSFDPVGTAIRLGVEVPTATMKAPLGASGWGWDFSVMLDKDFGPSKRCGFRSFCSLFRGVVNLGHAGIPEDNLENLKWDSRFFARAGMGMMVSGRWGLSFEASTHFIYTDRDNTAGRPIELTSSIFGELGEHWRIRAGGGKGITQGIGSPTGRAILLLSYEPQSW